MISDSGTVSLLAAVYNQARTDVEDIFDRIIRLRQACGRGRLAQHVAAAGLPLTTEDEWTALWWCGGPRRPQELAAMLAVIGGYERHCRYCCQPAGRGEDG